MIVLSDDQLKEVASGLSAYYPKSIQIDAIIRNRLKHQYVWPGTEIVVDKYPDYSVILYRPVADSSEYAPWPRGYSVTLFCRKLEDLAEIIRQDDFVNWSLPICFFGISKNDVLPILLERCREKNTALPYTPFRGLVHTLHPSHLVRRDLPEGFVLGELGEEHIEQVNREWLYGAGEETLSLFQYLRRKKFPSSAVFTNEGRLAAYINYLTDGSVFHGYVHPDFRNKGLYQVINYDIAEKAAAMGHPFAFLYVVEENHPSLNAYHKLGAKRIDPLIHCVDWLVYEPPTRGI